LHQICQERSTTKSFPEVKKNENRLVEVKKNSTVIAAFVLDRDGKQVKRTVNWVTTYYAGYA
jgi:ligand-binding sensor protein